VQWSPRGNALVFVYKNDIYFRPSASSANTARVTNNGEPGVNFNGVPDWLYEGEWLQRKFLDSVVSKTRVCFQRKF
jgi:Dipeptidyl peptidase IV (DPP IV) N-terminal region